MKGFKFYRQTVLNKKLFLQSFGELFIGKEIRVMPTGKKSKNGFKIFRVYISE